METQQSSWTEELIRWYNTHPEYEPSKEDSDSQRQQNSKETY
jgi:proteasome lid subunit RPN8/RPN11